MQQQKLTPDWVWYVVGIPFGLIGLAAILTGGNPLGVVLILAAVIGIWIMPVIVGHRLMKGKGRSGGAGIALGILLGWIGVLIVACLSTDPAHALRIVKAEDVAA